MRRQTVTAFGLASLLLVSASAPDAKLIASAPCAVTRPNQKGPPDAVLSKAALPVDPAFYYGNDVLWTSLWPDGAVVFKKGGAGSILPDGSLRMKFLWLLATDGPLTVTGRRLDGEARALTAEIPAGFLGKGFQPSYLIFPTVGCWEVTATANGSTLAFVTTVVTQGL